MTKADAFDKAMGRVIRQLRKELGLSQGDVGKHLGVSYQQINKYESGANGLAASYLPKVAGLFGVTVGDLYDRAGQMNIDRKPAASENDSFLAARYVGKIVDPTLRKSIVDFTRKLAYQAGAAA